MVKMLLLSILLVFIYQFDELVRAAHSVRHPLRHKNYEQTLLDSDHYVGTALAIAGMPLALNFLLVSSLPLGVTLFIIAMAFLMTSLLTAGLGVFLRRIKYANTYQGVSALVGYAYALSGFFHPLMRTMPWHTGRGHKDLSRAMLLFSLPAILGFWFKAFFNTYGEPGAFMRYIDTLIIVMVGGSFMFLVIEVLTRYFHRHRMPVLSLYRVALGIVITCVLLF
jgi:undecaprenyl pyrophosphate phosphatase UppP